MIAVSISFLLTGTNRLVVVPACYHPDDASALQWASSTMAMASAITADNVLVDDCEPDERPTLILMNEDGRCTFYHYVWVDGDGDSLIGGWDWAAILRPVE